jgi:hypothetical protein
MLLGLLHVALVAPHYHVGSFDDDASYILTAKALLSGHGLNGTLASGQTISGLYPPGYPALLAPLLWLWPHTFAPLRLLSVLCFAGLFPLTWTYLNRRGVSPGLRSATLVLLALGPPLATFASMVMAETPFLVVLMVLLLLVDRWDRQDRAWTGTALGVVLTAAGLVWLKQAGIGLVAGLLIWLALHHRPQRLRRVLAVAVGVGVLLAPVVIARALAGIPLAGARYSSELGIYYHGGLANRLLHVLPHSTWHLLATAIPATLVPYLEPLPLSRHWADFWIYLSWQVTILAAVGAVAWYRRYRDAALPMVLVYLAQSVLWPQVNERRAILVVPILAAWYVIGACSAWRAVVGVVGAGVAERAPAPVAVAGPVGTGILPIRPRSLHSLRAAGPLPDPPPAEATIAAARYGPAAAPTAQASLAAARLPARPSRPAVAAAGEAESGMAARAVAPFSEADRRRRSTARPGLLLTLVAAVLVLVAVVGPLVAQMPRDYLFSWGRSSSQFGGSRYAALLSRVGAPADVVETDYTSTTALFTGHRTANTAFLNEFTQCDQSIASAAIEADNAGYLLLGDVNKPRVLDNGCLLGQASTNPWAVPLLHTSRDDGFVFELIGPGTGHPGLTNLNAGVQSRDSTVATSSVLEYDWPGSRSVQQVSLGEAALAGTPTTSVEVDLRGTDGRWQKVAAAPSAVGDGRGRAPYLEASFADGVPATGMRIVVTGAQPGAPASISDVAALGPSAPTM